ncbi:phage putative hypothetical protein gp8 family [Rubellimicrobium thermophilum DSM 16684]|uniref:Uncharacterized protein n=1 Tax=Rubellimicrobium thermophilum DSM 16684 TaxID=1123069 RepID=S9R0T0_9RHOB|nr:hypothetical protein [Rubellimicrobium thermophilum]EPX87251.1 phage putative hypothetical protein gp8 family [Rubellimicrobium thermophilum DSM 16684]
MNLVELTEAPAAALPVQTLREHLRLGSGFADDSLQEGLLAGFLRAAIAAIEGRTGKALLSRDFAQSVTEWARPDRQPLAVAPVVEIAAVRLVDANGAETSLPPSAWRLDREGSVRPALVPVGAFLPRVPIGGQAIVTFTAGYGPQWADVPPDLAQAVLMLAAHYHDFRHDTALGPGCMPFGVTALIERYRPLRLGVCA